MPDLTKQRREVATTGDVFATTMVCLVVDMYGTECFEWHPETLAMELEDDLNIQFVPRYSFDRLLAGIQLVTSDDFYKSLPDFITLCNVLSGDTLNPQMWDPADSHEIAWGVTEALLLAPPEEDDENPFEADITAYIGTVLDSEGIITPPDVLRIATRETDPTGRVLDAFSDDPAMAAAVYSLEADKTTDIENALRAGLARLVEQLSDLPLQHGSTKDVVRRAVAATR